MAWWLYVTRCWWFHSLTIGHRIDRIHLRHDCTPESSVVDGFPDHYNVLPLVNVIRQVPGKLGGALVRLTQQLPPTPFATHGDHRFEANHGGAPMLDAELQAQFDFPPDVA